MKNKLLILTLLYSSLIIRSHANEKGIENLNNLFPTKTTEIIEITGDSSRSVIAETMEIQIPVKSHAVELVSAYKENKKITEKLVEQLKKLGFADDAIRSSLFLYSDNLDAMTKREKNEDRKHEIVTYTNVLVKDADQFIMLAEILNKDIEPYDEIRYYHSKDAEYREVVLVESLNNVKKQQDSYEEMFGVSLELLNIEKKVTLPRLDSSMGASSENMRYEATIVAKFHKVTTEPEGRGNDFLVGYAVALQRGGELHPPLIKVSGDTNEPVISGQNQKVEPTVKTPVE